MSGPGVARETAPVELVLRVQPGARRDEFAGRYGERIKLRIAAPANDGRANRRLLRFLAGEFGVTPASVRLLSGVRGRDKRVRIEAPARMPPWMAPPWPGVD